MAHLIQSLKDVKLSRWQVAMLVGTPILVGTTYWVYKKTSSKNPSTTDTTKGKEPSQGAKVNESEKVTKQNEVESVIKMTPLEEATMYKNEGNSCYKKGKYDEAINFYDKAIETCPKESTNDLSIFYQNRAAAYEMLKKWKCVKEDCTKSLENNPKYAKAYYRRAKAYEASNDMLECLYDITTTCVLEMFQNSTTVLYADRVLKQVGRIDAEKAMKTREPILPSHNFINTYFRSYANEPIIKFKIPEEAKDSPPTGFVKAKLALENSKYDEIIAACTEELENSESESQYKEQALLLRGTFYLLTGAFDEAEKDLSEIINNESVDADFRTYALIRRAGLRIQCENKEDCFADFDAAEALQPNNADIYQQRAQIYILLDRMEDALKEFDKAVQLSPNHALAQVQRLYAEYRVAILANDQRRLINVMNEFKDTVDKFPDCQDCYSLMAQVLSDQQQFAQSDSYYEKAMKMFPDNPAIYVHRAVLMLQWKGDVDKCLELMNQALEIDDKCELVYETLGTLEVQRANLDRAVELFEKAIRLAKGIGELTHLYSLRNAAVAQIVVIRKLGIDVATAASLRNIM